MRRCLFALCLASVLSCTANTRETATPARDATGPAGPRVSIEMPSKAVVFGVEVADTPKEREVGLMFRKELAPDRGMIFVFETTEDHHFWMKNTYIPLDMIFIGEDMLIAGIVHEAVPQSTESRSAGKPSRYVLEINGGTARSRGIVEGQKVGFKGVAGAAGR